MKLRLAVALLPFVVVSFAGNAQAQDEEVLAAPVDEPEDPDDIVVPPAAETAEVDQDADAPAALQSIVRGLYLDARVGGGFGVVSAEIPTPDPIFSQIQAGETEELGGGAQVGFHLGYDVTEALAIEIVSGGTFISGRRTDRVRDVGLLYGGVGARFSFELERRLNLTVGGAAIFAAADNGVEDTETGVGLLASGGIEYYVHVRHFSVGIDLNAVAPFSPSRVFIGLTPRLKYTF
ncbi:MAG: adventurous gliding motility protein CglE [Myxococcota bacterium]